MKVKMGVAMLVISLTTSMAFADDAVSVNDNNANTTTDTVMSNPGAMNGATDATADTNDDEIMNTTDSDANDANSAGASADTATGDDEY